MITAIITTFISLAILAIVLATWCNYHPRCPYCYSKMTFYGNVTGTKDGGIVVDKPYNRKKRFGYPHAYRCTGCGKIIVL